VTGLTVRPARRTDVPAIVEMVHELAAYEQADEQCRLTEGQLAAALFAERPAVFGHVAVRSGGPAGAAPAPRGATRPAPRGATRPAPRGSDPAARDGGEDDGVPVGMSLWFLNYSTWTGVHGIYLEDLYVRPAARGAGVGKALLAALADVCLRRGYSRLDWWVLDWNPAREFYHALGAGAMQQWVPYRLTGEPLARLATAAWSAIPQDAIPQDAAPQGAGIEGGAPRVAGTS
jgi:GNAT superfamily N-acetyltransferase